MFIVKFRWHRKWYKAYSTKCLAKQANATTANFTGEPGVLCGKFKFAPSNLFCARALCISCNLGGHVIGWLAMKWNKHSNGPTSNSVGGCIFYCLSRLFAKIPTLNRRATKCNKYYSQMKLPFNSMLKILKNLNQMKPSTTWSLHNHINEHLSKSTSSVYKHFTNSHDMENLNDRIIVKVIMSKRDPVNLQLKVAYYIHRQRPEINSWEECNKLARLLF